MQFRISALYKPAAAFNKLDKYYEEDLNSHSSSITFIVGCFVSFQSIISDIDILKEIASGFGLIVIIILGVPIFASLFVLIYNYFFSYLLYWIGKLLGSKGVVADTRISLAYALVPLLLSQLCSIILHLLPDSYISSGPIYWFEAGISLAAWIWSLTVLSVGLRILNKYGTIQAILNILPIVIIGIVLILVRLL